MRNLLRLVIIICSMAQIALGQVTITLNLRTPLPSQISVWEQDPTLVRAIIVNAGGSSFPNVRPSFTIRDLDRNTIVAYSNDNHPNIPRFTLPANTTIIRNGPDLINGNAVTIDQTIRTILTTTNSLPEGTYELCLKLLAEDGSELTSLPSCRTFLVVIPDPPTLISPQSGVIIPSTAPPTFMWTPVVLGPGITARYRLVITPVFDGQTPKHAIDANAPLLSQTLTTTAFYYGPTNPSFTLYPSAVGFAWQVQAVDGFGNPAARNEGKSEVFTFRIDAGLTLPNPIALSSPAANALVYTTSPTFFWSYTPHPGTPVYYKLQVVRVQSGQTAEQALTSNTPVYNPTTSQTSAQPTTALNLVPGGKYAWRVQAMHQVTNAVVATSPSRVFTYSAVIQVLAGLSSVQGKLHYEFADPGEYTGWPLPNTNIKLVVKYVLKYKWHVTYSQGKKSESGSIVIPGTKLPANKYKDNDKVVAVTKTSATGDFTFAFWTQDTTGVVQQGFKFGTIGGEFDNYYEGDLRRVYRIVVENPYYLSPNEDIMVNPGQHKTMGNVFAYVRSYAVTVKMLPSPLYGEQATHAPLAGMTVHLLRKIRPLSVPANEGSPRPETPMTIADMEVIATGITSGDPGKLGTVTFTRLVKNIASTDKYYIQAATDTGKGKWNYKAGPLVLQFSYSDDKAVFNDEYKYPHIGKDVYATPQWPVVRGRVVHSETGQPLTGVKVELLKYALLFWAQERQAITQQPGTFKFSWLPSAYGENGKITGPMRGLKLTKSGFNTRTFAVPATGAPLKPGEQWIDDNIILEPGATVSGKVANEAGAGVHSFVRIGSDPAVEAKPLFTAFPQFTVLPAPFTAKTEKLPDLRTVIAEPLEPGYFPETTKVIINKAQVDLGTIVLKKIKHKIMLMVREEKSGLPFALWPKVTGAKVKIKDLNIEKTTNQNGQAYFEFENDATQFVFIITAPPGQYYERKEISLAHQASKYTHFESVGIRKATFISGHVYVGTDKLPVNKARVFIEFGAPDNVIQSETDASGAYLLPNVPISQQLTVWATKPSSDTTFVGDSAVVTTQESGNQNVDFILKVYAGMDITKLMGFPVEVKTLQDVPGGKVRITGRFTDLPANSQFSVPFDSSSPTFLTFSNVLVEPGPILNTQGIPIARPVQLPVATNSNTLDLKVFGRYNASQVDQNLGIHLDDPGTGMGVLRGRVHVKPNSFNTGGSFGQWDGFYLSMPGVTNPQEKLKLPTITASGTAPVDAPDGFPVVSSTGDSLQFALYGFTAGANPTFSRLTPDTLRLRTTLHTNIEHITPKDLRLNIGDLRVTTSGVVPLAGATPITFKMDQWTLNGAQWYLAQSNLVISQGVLKTGKVDVPVKKLYVKPTEFAYSEFDLQSMSIGGIVPLSMITQPVLNYDNTNSEWFLFASAGAGNPCAVISGLPGMEAGDGIFIEAMRLTSKGAEQFSPVSTSIPIYKVGILYPDMVSVFPDFVEFTALTMHIPNVGALNGAIQYRKENNQIAFRLVPLPVTFFAKGVQAKFGVNAEQAATQKLDEKGFISRGTVAEEGKFQLITWLKHTVDSTSIWVETTPSQSLPIGAPKTSLQNITGFMRVVNNAWTEFSFSGDLAGTAGVTQDKKRLTFVVVGEIKATNQELGVGNIPTPFGGMSWTYEFENKRLIGSIPSIDKELYGQGRITGSATAVVDGKGWYFVAGGMLKLKNPNMDMGAAIVIGNYPNVAGEQPFKAIFLTNPKKYSHDGQVPAAFVGNLSGFYFSGLAKLPIPLLPSLNIDELSPVVHCEIDPFWGGNLALGMNFAQNKVYYTQVGAFLGVKASAGVGAGLACVGASLYGEVYLEGEGQYNTTTGNWFVEASANLTLSGSAYVGSGLCCDSECDCAIGACGKVSWSGSKSFGMFICRLGEGGPKFCVHSLCL